MKHKYSISILSILGLTLSLHADVGLDYLNTLREKTGLPAFTTQANLRAAAQNHSAYLQTNDTTGHYEDSTKSGYTGDYGDDRVIAAGYASKFVSENVSSGGSTVEKSIDNLFSAIYHRFSFLSLLNNEIGIGISNNQTKYTYNMGNSGINNLCENESYHGGGYYLICADGTKKLSVVDVNNSMNEVGQNAPSLILWPAKNSEDIPPVFNEESPDPLPNYSVSGYPISVEFNKKDFPTAPEVSSFTLETADTTQLDAITIMDESNDPNSHFSSYQFALFPEKRLEWGSRYNAEVIYTSNGSTSSQRWCFTTRSLRPVADKFYRISQDSNLNVISGQTYAFYLVPHNGTEHVSRTNYSYNTNAPDFKFIDSNTISITLTGDVGRHANFDLKDYFGHIVYQVNLTIANNDTATIPATATCDTDGDGILDENDLDDDNDGYSDIDEIAAGSDSRNANDKPLDTDGDKISNATDTDDDNDGLSDSIETAHGLNPLNASDAQADFDNDGFSNAIEISVGSDIRSAQSHPTWTPVIMGDIMIFIPSF